MASPPTIEYGRIAGEIQDEFPDLRLAWTTVAVPRYGRSSRELRERLRSLADQVDGRGAMELREQDVPRAYRTFYRQIGLDPDVDRTPGEEATLERMLRGGFPTHGMIADARTVAVVETGVPVWAIDAARLDGALGVALEEDRLVIADRRGTLALLCHDPPEDVGPAPETDAVALYAIQVPGVPDVSVSEALWLCRTMLAS